MYQTSVKLAGISIPFQRDSVIIVFVLRCRVLLFLGLLVLSLWGQQQAPERGSAAASQNQPPTETRDRTTEEAASVPKNSKAQKGTNGTSKDRLFFLLPNFLTLENADKVPPLTAAEKFRVTARGTFDPVEFGWYGMQAGISQAKNSDPTYGQGMEGYAKRFGVRFADGTVENFCTRAIFPSVLHQDPRYFQSGKGGFWHRAGYAMSRIVITRSDSGTTQFNFSEVLGSATAAGISSYTYHPSYAHNLDSALHVWGTQVGYDALSYAVKEFWPDIRRKLHHSKSNPAQAATN